MNYHLGDKMPENKEKPQCPEASGGRTTSKIQLSKSTRVKPQNSKFKNKKCSINVFVTSILQLVKLLYLLLGSLHHNNPLFVHLFCIDDFNLKSDELPDFICLINVAERKVQCLLLNCYVVQALEGHKPKEFLEPILT